MNNQSPIYRDMIRTALSSNEGRASLLNTLLYSLENYGDETALNELKTIYELYIEIIQA